jgi:uncharacterized protein YkwD
MRAQGWSIARAATAALFAGLLVATLAPTAADAASSAPTLQLKVTRTGDVKVQWKYTTDEPRDDVKLRIERKDPGQSTFHEIKTLNRPRPSASYTDREDISGVRVYQARLVIRGVAQSPGPQESTQGPTTTTTAQPGPPGDDIFDPPLEAGQTECPAGTTAEVLRLVNVERARYGRSPLRNDPKLAKAARQRSIDQAADERMSHDGWTATIRAYGYTGGALGENIAYGYGSPSAVVNAWIASDGHHANMLNGYRDSGVGCVISAQRHRIYWTHDFGA